MGISIWQLLIILAIVLVIFGAKRLKNVGTDLGSAIKGFKKAVAEDEDKKAADQAQTKNLTDEQQDQNVYDVQATEKESNDTKPKA
ncbi:Sec-independent protein translocase subunit TatA [Thiomicrospira cyclica]|jgi:sec-independent protein translocase protein TatA|uniref:Sec-independent protein translocase protein TatA n=1 Tax=Thiomicrospira cyclica (strain DSM 14477 / JCM 11371 / ALM1) TaxID=717773 RepID=F6DAW7_THICA|nr:Sec-independent protein translocase subunit TatA [Thiomicrospira cyclica]AEG32300.1 Sec-independent protein translocase protein tatA/E-like protein [Thiomicrospira cyclica ALM1]